MKQIFFENSKHAFICVLMLALIGSGLIVSCNSEDIDADAYYTFTGETIASFCQKNDSLSLFSRIVDESGNAPLLSVYGHFTCFAPTDSAINLYLKEEGLTYDELTKEEKATIVYNHVIRNEVKEYYSTDFQEGALPTVNMSDRFLSISYTNQGGKQIILVNKKSPIVSKDREVHNGVVHIVSKIVRPSMDDLLSIMQESGGFTLFAEALEKTHLIDSILGIYDYSYTDPGVDRVMRAGYSVAIPRTKKLGYTLFAEPDEVFKQAGINDFSALLALAKQYYGSEDLNDYTSRKNPLNKFISYHMLDRRMATNTMIYSGRTTTPYANNQRHEYYETMLDKRLMEIKAPDTEGGEDKSVQINTQRNGTFVGLNVLKSNIEGMNGYVHSLTAVLVCDDYLMENDILNKRMRIDPYSLAPELTNNNFRWNRDDSRTVTPDYCGKALQFNDATQIIFWACECWGDYQADQVSIRGWYDFTWRLPPIPPGTYEVRMGYSSRDWGGITQVFFDGQIVGIPIDFYTRGTDPSIGWIADSETTDNGVENDKMMRNKGYMKGAKAHMNPDYGNVTARNQSSCLRIIIGTYTFHDYDYHYLRAKNIQTEFGEFSLDYFEYVPVSYLNKETVD